MDTDIATTGDAHSVTDCFPIAHSDTDCAAIIHPVADACDAG
jgi:hypothetical protein